MDNRLAALLFTAYATTAHAQAPEPAPQPQPTAHIWAAVDPVSKKWCRVVFEDGASQDKLIYSRGTLKSDDENVKTALGDKPDTIFRADKINLESARALYELACKHDTPAITPIIEATL